MSVSSYIDISLDTDQIIDLLDQRAERKQLKMAEIDKNIKIKLTIRCQKIADRLKLTYEDPTQFDRIIPDPNAPQGRDVKFMGLIFDHERGPVSTFQPVPLAVRQLYSAEETTDYLKRKDEHDYGVYVRNAYFEKLAVAELEVVYPPDAPVPQKQYSTNPDINGLAQSVAQLAQMQLRQNEEQKTFNETLKLLAITQNKLAETQREDNLYFQDQMKSTFESTRIDFNDHLEREEKSSQELLNKTLRLIEDNQKKTEQNIALAIKANEKHKPLIGKDFFPNLEISSKDYELYEQFGIWKNTVWDMVCSNDLDRKMDLEHLCIAIKQCYKGEAARMVQSYKLDMSTITTLEDFFDQMAHIFTGVSIMEKARVLFDAVFQGPHEDMRVFSSRLTGLYYASRTRTLYRDDDMIRQFLKGLADQRVSAQIRLVKGIPTTYSETLRLGLEITAQFEAHELNKSEHKNLVQRGQDPKSKHFAAPEVKNTNTAYLPNVNSTVSRGRGQQRGNNSGPFRGRGNASRGHIPSPSNTRGGQRGGMSTRGQGNTAITATQGQNTQAKPSTTQMRGNNLSKPQIQCDRCGFMGHTKANCQVREERCWMEGVLPVATSSSFQRGRGTSRGRGFRGRTFRGRGGRGGYNVNETEIQSITSSEYETADDGTPGPTPAITYQESYTTDAYRTFAGCFQ